MDVRSCSMLMVRRRSGREKNKPSKGGMRVDEKEVYEICQSVDSAIAAELAESIVRGTSYDMLEAHHGILPISRRGFYRRRGTAKRIMRQRMAHLVEEKNGQYMIEWGREE